MNKKKICIIGAGPMGLAAAYQLVKDGYIPIIYEADKKIGGMTATFDFSGIVVERYYHFHCTSDTDYFELLKELKLEKKIIWKETKMGFWYDNRLQKWGNPLALLKFRGLSFFSKIRYGLHIFYCTHLNNWKKLDEVLAIEWICNWIGYKTFKILWKNLFDFKFYQYSKNISAAWIWSRINRLGKSRFNLMKEKLGFLEGGSDVFLNEIKKYIVDNGGNIHLEKPITKIKINKNNTKEIFTSEGSITYNTVISTIPIPYITKMIDGLSEKLIKSYHSIKNIAVVCVVVKLKKSLSENFWVNVNDPEMDIPGFVEYSNLRDLDNNIIYVPFYMPGENKKYKDSDDKFEKKVIKYLMKINKEIKRDDFLDIKVGRYRYSQPICGINFSKRLPPIQTNIKGLYVADTSYYYPEDRGISESIKLGRKIIREYVTNDSS